MAHEIGTASDLEDMFGKIVNFLTTDATLVAQGQEWEVLRLRRDNLAGITTNITESTAATSVRKIAHTFRYDPRTLNTNSQVNADSVFTASGFVAGSSYFRVQMKQAREVKTIRLKCGPSGYQNYMPRSFRLQYSDDGTSWTTALTVTDAPVFQQNERRDFSVTGTPGAHLYWQIILDALQFGSTMGWSEFLMLESDGTVANHFGSEVLLKARGNSGLDEIFTGIRSEYDAALGWYNLFMNGYVGYDANEPSWFLQPGALPGPEAAYPRAVPMVPLWNAAMPYWFVASGRSFRFAVKVSTNYEGGYLGFFLPYATPNQYPYPLAVGGSLVPTDNARSTQWRYSYVNERHGVFPGPGGASTNNSEGGDSTLYMRTADGEWGLVSNRPAGGAGSESVYPPSQNSDIPFTPSGNWRCVWPHAVITTGTSTPLRPFRECLGGGYMMLPCIILQRGPYTAAWGELEGTYIISGFQNAAENTTTYNGKTHVVFQNAYRNAISEFWALSLD